MAARVEIESLTKLYRNTRIPALDRVSLTIPTGSFFGLLGPNGAGKTTLMSIVCGVLEPGGGDVRIVLDEQPTHPAAARHAIGFVPQDFAFYPTLSVRENLAFFGAVQGLHDRLLDERIDACIALGQLNPFRHRRAQLLSGGLKRRLNLAIAMLHQPPLLVLDEPTSGIDAQSRRFLQDELKRLHREGTTIVYTSHYLEEVADLCDHLAIIDHGRIAASGTREALLGQSLIELRLAQPASSGLTGRLAEITGARDLKQAEGVIIITCEDPQRGLVRALSLLQAEKESVIEARLGSRSLETLFFQQTGIQLRDGDGDPDDHAQASRLR